MDNDYKNVREESVEGKKTETVALDDERRIKVLSPSMLVFKRFIRNKLAITGSIFIGFMFLFAFLGGWVMPYGQDQVFTEYTNMQKDYAAVSENKDFKFTTVDGSNFSMVARSQFVLSVNNKSQVMSAEGIDYVIENQGQDFFRINKLTNVAIAMQVGKEYKITLSGDMPDQNFKTAFTAALQSGGKSFESGGTTYVITGNKKNLQACISEPVAIASMNAFDFASAEADSGYEFRYQAETAMNELLKTGTTGSESFTAGGKNYELKMDGESAIVYAGDSASGTEYANISRYIVQATYPDVFLTIDFKTKVKELISTDAKEFKFTEADGTERAYTIARNNDQWSVKWTESTLVVDTYQKPSVAHPLGTDRNGMDLLTRLMYGGRVSLMIGFIVVFIETFIGVIIGGIAGYFKKYFDQLLMRLVDIFNSIPSLPIIIILGAMMDQLRVDPQMRMVYLMMVLGILGWPSMARMVRGQILSLREQEFMVAAEATGISPSRRIFKHLVPNVIPQLIVLSTMDLGNVIILESTLSFLGLGVKFPFASWGNIINDVNDVYVLTNFPFVWIPAGLCILITVLGFNFIGDGLRDAFDPKMKR